MPEPCHGVRLQADDRFYAHDVPLPWDYWGDGSMRCTGQDRLAPVVRGWPWFRRGGGRSRLGGRSARHRPSLHLLRPAPLRFTKEYAAHRPAPAHAVTCPERAVALPGLL